MTAGRNQSSEIRRQKSGVKLISDLRLLTSVIDDLNGFNVITNRLLTTGFLFVVVHAAQLLPVVPGYRLAEKLAVTRGHVCKLDTYTET